MKNGILILGLILGLLFLNSSKPYTSCNNPPKTRLDSLMSKKWRAERGDRVDRYLKDTMVSIWTTKGIVRTTKYVYYLTDDISKMGYRSAELLANFDWDKVGKSVNGKFLVTLVVSNKEFKICGLYEIIELTDKQLVLRCAFSTGEWVAYPDIFYKAEPLF